MKKLILLACFGLFNLIGSYAQELGIETKVDTIPGNPVHYTINVEVINGTGPFSYAILDNDPWNDGKVLEKASVNSNKYGFKKLSSGRYYVCVKDKAEKRKCIWITLD